MANLDWYIVLNHVKQNEKEAHRRYAEKQKKVEALFKGDKTVSHVLKGLRGLNNVTPLALGEVLNSYAKSFSPLEELADGWCFVVCETTEHRNTPIYLLQRNDENMGYIIDLDSTGLC